MLREKEEHVQKLGPDFVVVLQGVPFRWIQCALKLCNLANLGKRESTEFLEMGAGWHISVGLVGSFW